MGFILVRCHMPSTPSGQIPHNGLAAGRDRDMLDDDALLPALPERVRKSLQSPA
jgi:hypothetical protein